MDLAGKKQVIAAATTGKVTPAVSRRLCWSGSMAQGTTVTCTAFSEVGPHRWCNKLGRKTPLMLSSFPVAHHVVVLVLQSTIAVTTRRTSQKAEPRAIIRSPRPAQLLSLLQRKARIIGTHGVPSRWASVHRFTCRYDNGSLWSACELKICAWDLECETDHQ